jgi:hypothetical protein
MLLPLTDSPGAPGQGALAIECRTDDTHTRALLATLEDPATRGAIAVERQLLTEHGGGCHQRFGATLQWLPELGGLLQIGGRSASNVDIAERRWMPETALPAPDKKVNAWDGSLAPKAAMKSVLNAADLAQSLQSNNVFVAHSRALPDDSAALLAGRNVWTSGSASWFALAEQGVWVQGCAEGRGAQMAADLIQEPVLRLTAPGTWTVLTHAGAEGAWKSGRWQGAQVLATYAITEGDVPNADALANATHVFWHSVAQFDRARGKASAQAHHASGPGKTATHLRNAGVRRFQAFPSVVEWRKWIAQAR